MRRIVVFSSYILGVILISSATYFVLEGQWPPRHLLPIPAEQPDKPFGDTEAVRMVSLYELNSHPQKYLGRAIQVSGYLAGHAGQLTLYANEVDHRTHNSSHSVEILDGKLYDLILNGDEKVEKYFAEKCLYNQVTLTGRFVRWKYEESVIVGLTNITEVRGHEYLTDSEVDHMKYQHEKDLAKIHFDIRFGEFSFCYPESKITWPRFKSPEE